MAAGLEGVLWDNLTVPPDCLDEVGLSHRIAVVGQGNGRCVIDHLLEIGWGRVSGQTSGVAPVDVPARDRPSEECEQFDPLVLVGRVEAHLEPKATGANQGSVEHFRRSIGAGDDDRPGGQGLKTVECREGRGEQEPGFRVARNDRRANADLVRCFRAVSHLPAAPSDGHRLTSG